MKKVRFDTSGAIAFQLKLGRDLPPDERKPMKLEGWLVDDHLCVRKTKHEGWCLSLYPWGDRITAGFFTKDDVVACAKDIHALHVPWAQMHKIDAITSNYIDHVMKVRGSWKSIERKACCQPRKVNPREGLLFRQSRRS
jgi:hypothetical protein